MNEVGVDLSTAATSQLTPELAQRAQWLITMGCGDQCPVVPGLKRDDWPLENPKGQGATRVREIRDDIRQRAERLLDREAGQQFTQLSSLDSLAHDQGALAKQPDQQRFEARPHHRNREYEGRDTPSHESFPPRLHLMSAALDPD